MHLPNQRLRKPDNLAQGAQTSYLKVQWENTLDKRVGQKEREGERGRRGTRRAEQKEGSRGEHRVIKQEPRAHGIPMLQEASNQA